MYRNRLLVLTMTSLLAACGSESGNDNTGGTNRAPVAEAGNPQSVDAGVTVTLEGSGSDTDGKVESLDWSQTGGPGVTLDDGRNGMATFTAPSVQAATELEFELTVTDDGGKRASDDVTVTIAPVIAMVGRVYDGPLAGATVTMTVGDRTYVATADANGNYELNVGSVDPQAFVTITATGGEGQENVELMSIAGSFGALQAAAGEDGVLDDSEGNSVNVTNLSTAKAVLMIEANDGEPIDSDDEAAAAEKDVNGDEMIRLATVIKLVVDGGFELPADVESTLDLVGNGETTQAFIESVDAEDPTAFQQTQGTMLSDPELVIGFDASAVPPNYTLVTVDSFELTGTPEYMYQRGQRYTFNVDGSGTLQTDALAESGTFMWQVMNGEIVMTFDAPLIREGTCWIESYGYPVSCNTSYTRSYLRLVVDGIQADQLQRRNEETLTYPDNPELEDESNEETKNFLAFSASAEIPFDSSELPGTWAFQVAGPDLTGFSIADVTAGLLEFENGGIGTTVATDVSPSLDFNWQVASDGALTVDFSDGSTLTARRLREVAPGYDTQFLFETASGDVFSSAGLIVKKDGTADAIVANGYVGFFTLFGAHPFFSFIFPSDGSAIERHYYEDGSILDIGINAWIDLDGALTLIYRRDADTGINVAFCNGVSNCHLYRERIWIPVAFDEETGRMFVYERQQNFGYDDTQPENKGALEFVQSQVRFWSVSDTSLDGDDMLEN